MFNNRATDLGKNILLVTVTYVLQVIKTNRYKNYDCADSFLLSLLSVLIVNDLMQRVWFSIQAFLTFNIAEPIISNKTLSVATMVIIVFLLVNGISAFTNKKNASRIVYNALFVIGTINYFVLSITKKSFAFSDIKKAGTAFGVIKNIHLSFNTWLYFLIIVAVIVVFNLVITKLPMKENRAINKRIKIECLIASLSCIFVIYAIKDYYLHYYPNFNYEYITSLLIEYSDKIKEPKYMNEFKAFDNLVCGNDIKDNEDNPPNIIVIMNEAFCDLSVDGNFATDTDYIPYTKKIINDNPSGITYSSVFGNNTVSTELSFLTGIPTCLTASGAEIYDTIAGKDVYSILKPLKRNGYTTIGMHPFVATGYNRKEAWKTFGFDEIMFSESFKDAEKIREVKYVSDKSLYRKISETVKKNEKPVFCFAVTMQNHADYNDKMKQTINTVGWDAPDELNNYLTLQNESDHALRELIETIQKSKEPTYIMFFGDHQPMLSGEVYEHLVENRRSDFSDEEKRRLYKIRYFLWSNTGNEYKVPKETSMNYLPYILLDSVGIKDNWFEFTKCISDNFPVLTDNFFKYKGDWAEENLKTMLEDIHNIKGNDFSDLKQYQIYCLQNLTARMQDTDD